MQERDHQPPLLLPLGEWRQRSIGSNHRVKVAQLCLTLCDPMDYTVPGILQTRILEWVAWSPGIFPTQGSNLGLPHCRWILYQLSYKGRGNDSKEVEKWGDSFSRSFLNRRIFNCCPQTSRAYNTTPLHNNVEKRRQFGVSHFMEPILEETKIVLSFCPCPDVSSFYKEWE